MGEVEASGRGRPTVTIAAVAAGALLCLCLLLWFRSRPRIAFARDANQNVLVVTIDTLRADALGAYGGRAATPNLDRLADGDQLLLCTDGLTEMVPEPMIAQTLQGPGKSADICQALVDRALEAGGKDNVTVVLGRYQIPQA